MNAEFVFVPVFTSFVNLTFCVHIQNHPPFPFFTVAFRSLNGLLFRFLLGPLLLLLEKNFGFFIFAISLRSIVTSRIRESTQGSFFLTAVILSHAVSSAVNIRVPPAQDQ